MPKQKRAACAKKQDPAEARRTLQPAKSTDRRSRLRAADRSSRAPKHDTRRRWPRRRWPSSTTHRTEDPSKAGPRSYVVSSSGSPVDHPVAGPLRTHCGAVGYAAMPKDPATDEIAAAMVATPLLEGVSLVAVRRLADHGRIRDYRKGTYLCHQGDPADEIFFLVNGRVEIRSVSVTGNRVLHATVDTPQFVGELGVLAESDRTASVLTLEDSVVWVAARGGLLGVPRGRARGCSETAARPRAAGGVERSVRGRPALPRPQGTGGQAAPADGDALARTISRTTGRRSRRSRTPTSRASAAAAGRTSPACSPSSSVAGCWSATASATS